MSVCFPSRRELIFKELVSVRRLHVPGFSASSLCPLRALREIVLSHAKLAKFAKKDAKEERPRNVGDPRGMKEWSF